MRQCHNKCCEENAKKLEEWLEKFNQVSRDFFNGEFCNTEKCQQIKQLKKENKELKGIRDKNFLHALEEQKRADKLSKTLIKIKEIAEENIRIADLEGLNGVYRRGLAKQILQKISECEV